MTHLILASNSPRRRSFLEALGLDFSVDAAEMDESARPQELPTDLVVRLSQEKASAVALRHPGAVVLAADTVVVLDGRILGKPVDGADAVRMLRALRGRVHQVYTAVSLARSLAAGKPEAAANPFEDRAAHSVDLASRLCRSNVWMRKYVDAEILAYVATRDPLDKAGAYAIQHPAFAPVSRWEGCFASIMGLPLGMAAELLRAAGEAVPVDVIGVCEQFSGSGNCCLRGLPAKC